jgi:hypothetical protein
LFGSRTWRSLCSSSSSPLCCAGHRAYSCAGFYHCSDRIIWRLSVYSNFKIKRLYDVCPVVFKFQTKKWTTKQLYAIAYRFIYSFMYIFMLESIYIYIWSEWLVYMTQRHVSMDGTTRFYDLEIRFLWSGC